MKVNGSVIWHSSCAAFSGRFASLKERSGERQVASGDKSAVRNEASTVRSQGPADRSSKLIIKKPEMLNPFQAKLMELKKNFKK